MLLHDLARIARGVVTAARTALREPPVTAGLAVLDGAEVARPATPACYRVRLHNPGPDACALSVVVRGARSDGRTPPFEVRWTQALDARAAAERWIVTDWTGAAELHDVRPHVPPVVAAGPEVARWTIEARVDGPRQATCGHLRIEGSLAA
jgi:hypothetical protein